MKDSAESTETKDRRRLGEERDSRSGNGASEAERSTSWISVISGWLAALGASLILGSILGGVILLGGGSETAAEQSEVARLLVTLMAAFLIGGYVAGRMSGRLGLKHGLLVASLSLVATVVLVILGLIVGASLVDGLSGVTLPERPSAQAALSPTGILTLILPFVGAAFGGAWGAKTGSNGP